MATQQTQLACAARRLSVLACVLACLSTTATAEVEPLPSVASTFGHSASPLDQGPPLPAYGGAQPQSAEEVPAWTPYGTGTITNGPANDGAVSEPCYDCPPTGFEGCDDEWCFQVMPKSLIWHSYLAGPWEPRFASVWSSEKTEGWLWDIGLGGRVGICRWGSKDCAQPNGWEIQMEGAAFPRLDPELAVDLIATDYRFGVPLVYGNGAYQMKFGFYHISSHLGDEYMENTGAPRINFGRNALAWGHSYYWTPDLRLYGELDWAWDCEYSEPLYMQFGFDWVPILSSRSHCTPFVAMNCQLREELDFSGSFVAQAGIAWRNGADRRMFRVGIQYYTGGNQQFEFYQNNEEKVGLGLWYDY